MGKWKDCCYFKDLSIYSIKSIIRKLNSLLRFKHEGHRNGLVNLYKEMEPFKENDDIQIMWKMIQVQSSTLQCTCTVKRTNRCLYWTLCFRPT
ncbi:hypothetical protein AAZX31_01G113500 [Glycine max]|uniref:Uncharacterized protein n=2 Tax=Glycine subgen. Soja TaxID=1462606 RepID=K7K3G6_SOYBN|nr:hypothetical protein JHK87_001521 [Glycine soja]KAG5069197.1 hypothetical protein JHK85_001574 [Glycine max]KAG5088920.1 hypothetical protein JHK86_001532 [Glycine max]KAH1162804.1 hypothetical protein GYH30_001349 [Glycine max]KAH1266211.1 hypothetical protein GmHk_01G001754 [Glycine max]